MNIPDWKKEEIILLLDFHFRFRIKILNQKHPAVKELCDTLKYINRENGISESVINNSSFRSESSVIIKRRAIKEIDEGLERKTSHSKLDYELWSYYNVNLIELKRIAQSIREKYNIPAFLKNIGYLFPICEENYEYIILQYKTKNKNSTVAVEGKSKLRIHYSKERNQYIVKEKKLWALDKFGKLQCEVCEFDFYEVYGEIGKDFIECHHLKPLSEISRQEIIRIEDLALVCSNCHRMIHRESDILSLDELKSVITKVKTQSRFPEYEKKIKI